MQGLRIGGLFAKDDERGETVKRMLAFLLAFLGCTLICAVTLFFLLEPFGIFWR